MIRTTNPEKGERGAQESLQIKNDALVESGWIKFGVEKRLEIVCL